VHGDDHRFARRLGIVFEIGHETEGRVRVEPRGWFLWVETNKKCGYRAREKGGKAEAIITSSSMIEGLVSSSHAMLALFFSPPERPRSK
jgi:hypothetical protein